MRWLFPFFLLITLTLSADAKVLDYVEITVNNIPILHSEIEKYASENKVNEETAAEELINKALLLSEAKKEGLSIDDKTLEKALENLAKANGFKDVETFRKAVEKRGIQWEALKKKVKEQLLIQKLIVLKIKRNLKISGEDIEKTCQAEGTKAREVYYAVTDNSTLAEEIKSFLKEGLSFENATKICTKENNCKSGFIGDVKRGMLLKPIDNIVWSSKIGIPQTVTINGKIYVIYVKGEKQEPCDKKKIEEKLLKKEYEKALKSLVERLKSTAHIEYFKP
ncbi:SurA N-terminal domain-containing protein [Desulfurobacterium sp.]